MVVTVTVNDELLLEFDKVLAKYRFYSVVPKDELIDDLLDFRLRLRPVPTADDATLEQHEAEVSG
jgi:hypothetical protein